VAKVAASRITSKGQVTIPEEIRRRADLQAGERIEWEVTDRGTIELRKAGGTLAALTRILPRPKRALTVEEMDRAVGEHLASKHRARR
jgi:AbrB family looped-hinge helix DNA binding protein